MAMKKRLRKILIYTVTTTRKYYQIAKIPITYSIKLSLRKAVI